jgi:thymidine phosphorylase
MGAGRTRADQPVDHAVGIELCCSRGERVDKGQPLALLHVHEPEAAEEPATRLRAAFAIDPDADEAQSPPLVLDRLRA